MDFALLEGYEINGFLGKGSYGCVYSATRRFTDDDGNPQTEEVAIKRVTDYSRRRNPCVEEYQLQFTRRIAREVEILYTFRNNYEFVEMKDLYLSPDGLDLYIVMPCIHNSLQSTLSNPKVMGVGLNENIVRNLVLQILLGLWRMKRCSVMHRDLTPANILVETSDSWNCFLADFGLGRAVEYTNQAMTLDVVTLPYRPPEILMQCEQMDNQVDVWSLGCVMTEMFRGAPFIHQKDHTTQLARIIMNVCGPPNLDKWRGRASDAALGYLEKHWSHIESCQPTAMKDIVPQASEQAVEVLTAMLQFDPADRSTPEQLLQMEWFSDEICQNEIQAAKETESPEGLEVYLEDWGHEELIQHVERRSQGIRPTTVVTVELP